MLWVKSFIALEICPVVGYGLSAIIILMADCKLQFDLDSKLALLASTPCPYDENIVGMPAEMLGL